MNLLLDGLPDHINVYGLDYPIKTDFRTWIRFEQIMLQPDELKKNRDYN